MKRTPDEHGPTAPRDDTSGVMLEITVRHMAPLDDLVLHVKGHAAHLEPLVDTASWCSVMIARRPSDDGTALYEVHVRVVSGAGRSTEAHDVGSDLFGTVDGTFDALRRILRSQHPLAPATRRPHRPQPPDESTGGFPL